MDSSIFWCDPSHLGSPPRGALASVHHNSKICAVKVTGIRFAQAHSECVVRKSAKAALCRMCAPWSQFHPLVQLFDGGSNRIGLNCTQCALSDTHGIKMSGSALSSFRLSILPTAVGWRGIKDASTDRVIYCDRYCRHVAFRFSEPFRKGLSYLKVNCSRVLHEGRSSSRSQFSHVTENGDNSREIGFNPGEKADGLEGADGPVTGGLLFLEKDEAGARRFSIDESASRLKSLPGRSSEVLEERAYLIGIECKDARSTLFGISDSLSELAQLANTAGLLVVGSSYQKMDYPNPRTYIGAGKVAEVHAAIHALGVETVIFDDELSPGQLRNLEKAFRQNVRVCDRTALILDIFSQRAATREAALQVELAQMEYQLPRLTQMWTHLERQAGGMVKGMGEKQIEVDKRILRNRMASLRKELEAVRKHRQQYRDRRASVPIPVISLVGYTNSGKSSLLNRLSGAGVVAEDRLFVTLDPTTRRIELQNGKQCLVTDTVGFIQKLPTQLVASFRATLEEITYSSLLVHVVDISHPLARQQMKAVKNVLTELGVGHIPQIMLWNKIDRLANKEIVKAVIASKDDIICISALTGEGIENFFKAVQCKLKESMVWIETFLPYGKGDLVATVHRLGIVDQVEYEENGIAIKAHVPLSLSRRLHLMQQV